jgi:hypothetical protein
MVSRMFGVLLAVGGCTASNEAEPLRAPFVLVVMPRVVNPGPVPADAEVLIDGEPFG